MNKKGGGGGRGRSEESKRTRAAKWDAYQKEIATTEIEEETSSNEMAYAES